MEKLFYTAKDIAQMTGFKQHKSYEIIRKLNSELLEQYKDSPQKPLIFEGRVNKEYFDKRIKIEGE